MALWPSVSPAPVLQKLPKGTSSTGGELALGDHWLMPACTAQRQQSKSASGKCTACWHYILCWQGGRAFLDSGRGCCQLLTSMASHAHFHPLLPLSWGKGKNDPFSHRASHDYRDPAVAVQAVGQQFWFGLSHFSSNRGPLHLVKAVLISFLPLFCFLIRGSVACCHQSL